MRDNSPVSKCGLTHTNMIPDLAFRGQDKLYQSINITENLCRESPQMAALNLPVILLGWRRCMGSKWSTTQEDSLHTSLCA